MKSSILWYAVAAGIAYAGLCAYLFAVQRSLIYFPVAARDEAAADDLRIGSDGETVQVWRRSAGQARAIIYFGGNAEDVAWNLPLFAEIFPDYALYLVNYRGYAASTGSPTEAGLYADALSVYAHVAAEHDSVSVIGRSLGSGVATYVAANRPVERLALVTPFDSMVNVARAAYPFVPVALLLRDRYDSAQRARHITAPTLLLIAGADEFIPRANAVALARHIVAAEVIVEVIENTGHNTIGESPVYAGLLRDFF